MVLRSLSIIHKMASHARPRGRCNVFSSERLLNRALPAYDSKIDANDSKTPRAITSTSRYACVSVRSAQCIFQIYMKNPYVCTW